MKLIYLQIALLVVVLFSASVQAQTSFRFTYDDSGNRVSRAVISLKSASITSDTLQAKQAKKPLEDQVGLQKTRIYPNPTKGLLRIEFPGLAEQGTSIRVFDSNGRLIIQKTGAETENELDLSAYPPGFYILTIRSGQEKKEWKIIKE